MSHFPRGLGVLLLAFAALAGHGAAPATAQGGASAIAYALDAAGTLVPGACFSSHFSGNPFPGPGACDGDDGAEDGVTTVQNIFPQGVLVLDRAPEGFLAGVAQEYVWQGAPVELSFTLEPGGEALAVEIVSDEGESIAGACVGVFEGVGGRPERYLARGCDTWDGEDDGELTISGLSAGEYMLGAVTTPSGWVGFINSEPATVEAGDDNAASYVFQPAGAVEIAFVDETGAAVPELCAVLEGTGGSSSVCAFDSSRPGVASSTRVPIGTYEVVVDDIPVGYQPPDEVPEVEVVQGETTQATVVIPTGGQGISVTVVDDAGTPLTEFCVGAYPGQLSRIPFGAEPVASRCYGSAPFEPVVLWGVEPGTYSVFTENVAPPYTQAEPVVVEVGEGQQPQVTVVHQVGATVLATSLDNDGAPIPGACFSAFYAGDDGIEYAGFACDGNFTDETDGVVALRDLPVGEDVAVVPAFTPNTPTGLARPSAQVVRTDPGVETTLTFKLRRGAKTAVIERVGEDGRPALGSCFVLFKGDGGQALDNLVGYDCDGGVNADGIIELEGLTSGDYLAYEFIAPEDESLLEDPVPLTVERGVDTRVVAGGPEGEAPSAGTPEQDE